jgi:5-formyltetrahydrofolate cyclo-ligase
MTKQELRKIYKAKRGGIHPKERLRMDNLLLLRFQQFNYASVRNLLAYWPISTQAEPNTHLFSRYLRHIVPGLTIAYPVVDSISIQMSALQINEDTIYQTNQWGITEPKEGAVLTPEQVDLIFIPLLIFDKQGYRVGYGKGFYDRYLPNCRKDVVKIGFSYFDPIDEITDRGQFDVPLTYCITPQQTYEF